MKHRTHRKHSKAKQHIKIQRKIRKHTERLIYTNKERKQDRKTEKNERKEIKKEITK